VANGLSLVELDNPMRRLPLLAPFLLGLLCCRSQPTVSAEEAIFERRRRGLETLIAAAERGSLIPFNSVLVTVEEGLVEELMTSAMPYERTLNDRYRVRVTSASVRFDDGFGLVRLNGRASLTAQPEQTFADVSVFGAIDVVDLDPSTGVLRAQVKIVAFETQRVDLLGVTAPMKRLVEELGRQHLENFAGLANPIEIPVQLKGSVTLPAVGPKGEVQIAEAKIPLHVGIVDVKAFGGKLWVSIDATTGSEPPKQPQKRGNPS